MNDLPLQPDWAGSVRGYPYDPISIPRHL